jgi:hypothetical protein
MFPNVLIRFIPPLPKCCVQHEKQCPHGEHFAQTVTNRQQPPLRLLKAHLLTFNAARIPCSDAVLMESEEASDRGLILNQAKTELIWRNSVAATRDAHLFPVK